MKTASWSEKYRHYKRAPNLHYLARSGWVLWLNTDVFLYKSLWENYPLVPLYCDLRDCFTDGFMDSVTSFSLIEYSIIFIFKIMILTTKHKSGKRLFMSFIYSLWSHQFQTFFIQYSRIKISPEAIYNIQHLHISFQNKSLSWDKTIDMITAELMLSAPSEQT